MSLYKKKNGMIVADKPLNTYHQYMCLFNKTYNKTAEFLKQIFNL